MVNGQLGRQAVSICNQPAQCPVPATCLHLRPIKSHTAGDWSFQSRSHRKGNNYHRYTHIWWIIMDITRLTRHRLECVLSVVYCAVSIWWPWAVWCLWNNYHCVLIVSPLVSRGQIFRTISSVWVIIAIAGCHYFPEQLLHCIVSREEHLHPRSPCERVSLGNIW